MRKLFEWRREKKPQTEEEREQKEFEQRFQRLPQQEQDTYFQAMTGRLWLKEYAHFREEANRSRRPSKYDEAIRALETHDKQWSRFALSMLETVVSPLEAYAGDPDSFKDIKDRFKLVPLISHLGSAHEKGLPYGRRSSYETEPESNDSIYMDDPFGYVVRYLRNDGKWEVISVLTFLPDFEKGILYVDQAQGGNTSRGRATDEARDARYKFEKPPLQNLETVLYGFARELARRTGMKEVALRKGASSRWDTVKDKARKATSVYERIALMYEMENNKEDEYYRDRLLIG